MTVLIILIFVRDESILLESKHGVGFKNFKLFKHEPINKMQPCFLKSIIGLDKSRIDGFKAIFTLLKKKNPILTPKSKPTLEKVDAKPLPCFPICFTFFHVTPQLLTIGILCPKDNIYQISKLYDVSND